MTTHTIFLPVAFILITALASFMLIGGLTVRAKNKRTVLKTGLAILSTWLLVTGVLAWNGFYLNTEARPPRFMFTIAPMLLMILWLVTGKRQAISLAIPLRTLMLIHIIRIPVEFVLLQLYHEGKIPLLMTFEGRNFDILSGITAPIIYWLAVNQKKVNKKLLVAWNIAALLLLLNIVINAALSVPTPFQQFAFDQPDVAVLMFPYVWLPSVVVPIVLYAHVVSLMKLIKAPAPAKTLIAGRAINKNELLHAE